MCQGEIPSVGRIGCQQVFPNTPQQQEFLKSTSPVLIKIAFGLFTQPRLQSREGLKVHRTVGVCLSPPLYNLTHTPPQTPLQYIGCSLILFWLNLLFWHVWPQLICFTQSNKKIILMQPKITPLSKGLSATNQFWQNMLKKNNFPKIEIILQFKLVWGT